MLDFPQEIRTLLSRGHDPDRDFVVDLAAEYAEEIAACNERLQKIISLIDSGFTEEAVAAAEESPPILDRVAQLDTPQVDQWSDFLIQLGLDPPPELRLDLAERVDDLFTSQVTLEVLLKKHRLANLSRASAKDRIRILRQLVRKSSENAGWREDLQRLERVRIKEVVEELQAASSKNRVDIAQQLEVELSSADWSIKVPREVIQQSSELLNRLRAALSRNKIEALLPEMHSALLDFDVEGGRKLREELLRLAKDAGISTPLDPAFDSIRDAFEWLRNADQDDKKQEEFGNVLNSIESALDQSADLERLRRLMRKAEGFDQQMPGNLSARAHAYLESLELSKRRKSRLIVGTVATVLLCISAATLYSIRAGRIKDRREEATRSISRLVEKGEYESAVRLYESLRDSDREVPELLASVEVARQRVKEINDQSEHFRQLISLIEQQGYAEPDVESLTTARRLATTSQEKADLDLLESRIREKQLELQSERGARFDRELAGFEEEFKQLLSRPSTVETTASIREVKEDAQEWRRQFAGTSYGIPKVSQARQTQAEIFFQGIDKELRSRKELERMERQIAAISEAIGQEELFLDRLLEFVNQFPDAFPSEDLRRIPNEQEAWKSYVAWHDYLVKFDWSDLQDLPSSSVEEVLNEGRTLLESHPDVAIGKEFERKLPVLNSRLAKGAIPDIQELLNDPLVSNVQLVVILKQGGNTEKYYVQGDIVENREKTLQFNAFDSLSLVLAEKTPPANIVEYQGPSPQALVAESCRAELNKFPKIPWEIAVLKAIESWIAVTPEQDGSPDVDPIFRLVVLNRLIQLASNESELLRTGLSPINKLFGEGRVNLEADWVRANDESANNTRPKAEALIRDMRAQLEALAQTRSKIESNYASAMSIDPGPKVEWRGWLMSLVGGEWTVKAPGELPPGNLYCILPKSSPAGIVRLEQIGTVLPDGNIELRTGSDLVSGRPVFLESAQGTLGAKRTIN